MDIVPIIKDNLSKNQIEYLQKMIGVQINRLRNVERRTRIVKHIGNNEKV